MKGTAQNALWLAKAKAGDYVKVITAYLTGLKMIIATHSYHRIVGPNFIPLSKMPYGCFQTTGGKQLFSK